MSKIAFIGGGSFGSALSVLLAKKGNEVAIYDRDEYVVNDINKNKRNSKYLKDLIIFYKTLLLFCFEFYQYLL